MTGVDQDEEEDIDDIYERDGPSQPNRRQRRPPASPATERATAGRKATTTKKKQPNHHVEEEEESAESISMKSTLSDADFFSVESPITTDSEAFNYKPGVFKRTASLVKNPALTLRHRATTTRDGKADEQLMKRMKHGRHVARVDNRKKERAHRLPPPAKIHKKKQKEKKEAEEGGEGGTRCRSKSNSKSRSISRTEAEAKIEAEAEASRSKSKN